MRLYLLIICLCFSLLSMGMTFAPTENKPSYNNLSIGDNYEQMIKHFGAPRYSEPDYLWGQKVTYYIYKNNNKIGINDDTKQIVDMIIVDDTYNHNDDLKLGMTPYKIEKLFGKAERQLVNGEVCYLYSTPDKIKLIINVEPTDRYLESFRITNLPIELPEDTTQYVPDNATDETENPLMRDKTIDTSAIAKPAKDRFNINYNYSFTK